MTREEAFERGEQRRYEDDEMRGDRNRPHTPEEERRRWAMGKGYAEGEYKEQSEPKRWGRSAGRPDWRPRLTNPCLGVGNTSRNNSGDRCC